MLPPDCSFLGPGRCEREPNPLSLEAARLFSAELTLNCGQLSKNQGQKTFTSTKRSFEKREESFGIFSLDGAQARSYIPAHFKQVTLERSHQEDLDCESLKSVTDVRILIHKNGRNLRGRVRRAACWLFEN
ncbi:MAG TPA: hypothetical protein VKK31_13195 [Thermoanaerobaculia bacterium]|nr:hypothetical protein [Thermoanaerobaculia bacterium]